MRVITNMLAPKEYESKNEYGNILNIDMYDTKDKDYFSPMETLLASLASCACVDLVEMIKKRRKNLFDLQVETKGKRREEHPRAYESIHMIFTATSDNLKEDEFMKLVELAAGKYCSVSGTLNVKATYEVVIKEI
ncbi:hypothetical protein MATR_27700 [Marivirga tractuosa]|uniref:OsmC family protein n=1 Tax=Marivirga tractuosa (strain ATCC 23168 / DSM 4126 / NBRC 15989 / NCIMB 1408 / VKM B-1430 / H-43) TaxID=643867 RepID=E4TLV1_MARTH|nr:OsmC family protein [Marivirga tractuosa]ADR23380.1 OsmC family protein [Marivirga tractuosa DSM 4126]BDD15945.1 hypothetical protein MATR_27700 [Marivirga tractuosa]